MTRRLLISRCVPRFVAAAAVLLLVAVLFPAPVQAHAPSGASKVGETGLQPIWVFDEADDLDALHKFVIEDNDVRGYAKGLEPEEAEFEIGGETHKAPDGSLCICETCVFRVIQLAISHLWPEDVPVRSDFEVTWAHRCPSQEKTLRYILGDAATYHKKVPEGTSKLNLTTENYRYVVTNLDTGESFEAQVREGILPDRFMELRTKVKTGKASDAENAEFSRKWDEVRDKFLTLEASELFEFEEDVEEESAPVGQMVFAFGLLGAVAGATGYSVLLGRTRAFLRK